MVFPIKLEIENYTKLNIAKTKFYLELIMNAIYFNSNKEF